MITIYDVDDGDKAYVIRPCPLINITWNGSTSEGNNFGGSYEITLNGTLLDGVGSPIFTYSQRNAAPDYGAKIGSQYYPTGKNSKPAPTDPILESTQSLNSILAKQNAITKLFAKKCLRFEVASVEHGETEPCTVFYPVINSVSFSEGVWLNRCDYSISMTASHLLDRRDHIIGIERHATNEQIENLTGGSPNSPKHNIRDFAKEIGFAGDLQESWTLEPQEGTGSTFDPLPNTSKNREPITRIYRLSRTLSATGKNSAGYNCDSGEGSAHQQARKFITSYLNSQNKRQPGNSSLQGPLNEYFHYLYGAETFGSGVINLNKDYRGFNHSRTENFDVTAGTYGISDTWILCSGSAHEDYSMSISFSQSDPLYKISLNGKIQGLTEIPASGSVFGGDYQNANSPTAYENAITKYREITADGSYGISSYVYKRVQMAAGAVGINPKPLSVTLGTNEFTGEITYALEYDSRPENFVNGVTFENVSVNDTYPGDVFAMIPVLGRKTGPVLQYLGTRTEYRRDLTLEVIVDRNFPPPRPGLREPANVAQRQALLLKPSLTEPTRSGILGAINAYSPAFEPGVRKYFVDPPRETWDPKSGRYTLNITWTYELNY